MQAPAVTTGKRLVLAATALLDSGGEEAVTLRAVANASDVSHNAPYKHFKSRDALLAAVATADFEMLSKSFGSVRQSSSKPRLKLLKALKVVIAFSLNHPARYRLLFNDPAIAALKGDLEQAALAAFGEFIHIVTECQDAQVLPDAQNIALAGLMFATMHGLIALKASGRMHAEKGLTGVGSSLQLLVDLMSPRRKR